MTPLEQEAARCHLRSPYDRSWSLPRPSLYRTRTVSRTFDRWLAVRNSAGCRERKSLQKRLYGAEPPVGETHEPGSAPQSGSEHRSAPGMPTFAWRRRWFSPLTTACDRPGALFFLPPGAARSFFSQEEKKERGAHEAGLLQKLRQNNRAHSSTGTGVKSTASADTRRNFVAPRQPLKAPGIPLPWICP